MRIMTDELNQLMGIGSHGPMLSWSWAAEAASDAAEVQCGSGRSERSTYTLVNAHWWPFESSPSRGLSEKFEA